MTNDLRAAVAALHQIERHALLVGLAERWNDPTTTVRMRSVWHGVALEVADVDDLSRTVERGLGGDPDSWPWSS